MLKIFIAIQVFMYSVAASAVTVFIAGAGSTQKNFEPYWQGSQDDEEVLFFVPDTSPFSADHRRDLEKLRSLVSGKEEISIVAYSVGGKFGYKLATLLPERVLKKLVLLDPVGGPPPQRKPSEQFPVWLDDQESAKIAAKTILLASDPALSKKYGFSFTDGEYGPARYRAYLSKARYVLSAQTSHTSFLFPPLTLGARLFCKRGDLTAEAELRRNVKDLCGFK